MPNLLHLVPKFTDRDWQWASYVLGRYYPAWSNTRQMVFKTKEELMFSDLDILKVALNRSINHAAVSRDYDLYRKIYGVDHAKSKELWSK